jgi:hypothetical protein
VRFAPALLVRRSFSTLCRRSVVLFSLNSGEAKSQRAWRASFAAVLLRPLASETQALRMPLVCAAALLPFGRCALSRRNALVRRQKTQAVACRCYSFSRSSSLVAQALSHVRRRCFPSLRSAGILVAFISGEASCITRLSRRTPNGVRALHALHSLGAAHIYVMPQLAVCEGSLHASGGPMGVAPRSVTGLVCREFACNAVAVNRRRLAQSVSGRRQYLEAVTPCRCNLARCVPHGDARNRRREHRRVRCVGAKAAAHRLSVRAGFVQAPAGSSHPCFPWSARFGILAPSTSGEAECITGQSRRTHKCVRALRTRASCAPLISDVRATGSNL